MIPVRLRPQCVVVQPAAHPNDAAAYKRPLIAGLEVGNSLSAPTKEQQQKTQLKKHKQRAQETNPQPCRAIIPIS
ncbi:hypothetical protein V499_05833 [Pseudogymnoascus sp. VKM F-103]|nr:hypothetical protein V499_05833 [Pseudogymnoascus sp. VKM F-103]